MPSQGAPAAPNAIRTDNLKSRILHVAQTSVYQVKLQPPDPVVKFLKAPGRDVNYESDEGTNIELMCSETNLPGSSLATHDVTNDYPGVTEKMAYRRIYDETIDFTFMVDRNYKVVEFLEGWLDYVTGQGSIFSRDDMVDRTAHYEMNYPSSYKTDSLYITKWEKDNSSSSMTYQFIGAFPLSIVSMPVSYEGSSVLKCSASFSYMRYIRKRSAAGRQLILQRPDGSEISTTIVDGRPTLAQLAEQLEGAGARGFGTPNILTPP